MNKPLLENCGACGKEIAVTAKHCPSCGHKNYKDIYWLRMLIYIGVAIFVIALAVNLIQTV